MKAARKREGGQEREKAREYPDARKIERARVGGGEGGRASVRGGGGNRACVRDGEGERASVCDGEGESASVRADEGGRVDVRGSEGERPSVGGGEGERASVRDRKCDRASVRGAEDGRASVCGGEVKRASVRGGECECASVRGVEGGRASVCGGEVKRASVRGVEGGRASVYGSEVKRASVRGDEGECASVREGESANVRGVEGGRASVRGGEGARSGVASGQCERAGVAAARRRTGLRSVSWMAFAAVLLVTVAGCDGSYQQFLDAIPVVPASASAGPVQVFVGIDGMSRQAFDRARAKGAFADWNAADLVTVFPGTSDYAWTRTLRAGAIGGYEIQYFDPQENSIQNAGLLGVAQHPLHEGIAGTFACYQRFDYLGNGETWQLDSYLDPVEALPATLDALFDTVSGRARTQSQVLAYLINVDVGSHEGGLDTAVAMLVELDRRIRAFQADHQRLFQFTIFADHGNAHLQSTLVDPNQILKDVGITPVETLPVAARADAEAAPDAEAASNVKADGTRALVAVPIVHVRVNYVALHALAGDVSEIAARTSRHARVDLAVTRLPSSDADKNRYAIWRQGTRYSFARDAAGQITVDDPDTWTWLGLDLRAWRASDGATAQLDDRVAFEATRSGPYPDLFYRVATAFTNPAARNPADILLSLPDDIASFGFTVPGTGDIRAVNGFHGSLSRASTISVVASQGFTLPPAVRSDDLADMFPLLAGVHDRN